MARRSFYIKESEMDDFQRKVINRRSEGSLIVRGCAGSGKSVIAFWKLHDIVSSGKGSVQMVVFTRALKDYFVEGCTGEGINPNLIDYWSHWEKNPRKTDYVLVDEAQDFSEANIKMFQAHAEKALLLYGDSSQQIYTFLGKKEGGKRVSMEEIRQITGFPDECLVFNHRLPRRVARVAEYVNAEHDDLSGRCKDEGTENPYILRYRSVEEQLDTVANLIRTRGFDDVGILVPNNEKVISVSNYLRSKGLDVESKCSRDNRTYSTLNFATSNPKVMTYHSAKGLQFGAVFLPECEDAAVGRFLEPLYVAMTRTYQSLYILYTDRLPQVLSAVPTDLYERDIRTRETELL